MINTIDSHIENISKKNQITCILSKPGSGTSGFINDFNLSLCLNEDEKPLITTIGFFSNNETYLHNFINEDNNKKFVKSYNIGKDESSWSINFFDILLGSDKPTSTEKTFISSVLLSIYELDCEDGSKQLELLVDNIIDNIYSKKKYYTKGEDNFIDNSLSYCNFYGNKLSWKSMRNIFIENNLTDLAYYAHKKSMPLIDDVIEYLDGIPENLKEAISERSLKSFRKSLNNLKLIAPFLNKTTNIDICDNELLSNFNLGLLNIHNTNVDSLIYLIFLLHSCKKASMNKIIHENSYMKKESYLLIKNKIKEAGKRKKRILIDNIEMLDNKILVKIENILKESNLNVEIVICSMSISSFRVIGNIASSIYVFGTFGKTEKEKLMNSFPISNESSELLLSRCLKNFHRDMNGVMNQEYIALFRRGNKIEEHVCVRKINTVSFWETSASLKDLLLLKNLRKIFTEDKTRELLFKLYPEGFMDSHIPERKIKRVTNNIIKEIIDSK